MRNLVAVRRAAWPALLVTAFIVVGVNTPVAQAQPSIGAPAYIVIQPSTGDVVASRNPRQKREIASTTKMMTALLTIEHTSPSHVYTVAPYAAGPGESVAGLRAGQRMRVADLLRALLLPSANDAAHTLAVGVGGSQRAFVRMMNRRARQLGLTDTHYTTPIGLDDPRNQSSARDLVRLAGVLRTKPFLRATMDLKRAVLHSGPVGKVVVNRNTLVQTIPWVNGVKTGHTNTAGYVLVASASRRGVPVLSAVLGTPSEAARNADSLALLRYATDRYHRVTALRYGQPLATVPLAFRDQRVTLVAAHTIRRIVRKGERTTLRVVGVPAKLNGPLPRGTREGTVLVRWRGRTVAHVALITAAPVAAATVIDRINDTVPGGTTAIAALIAVLASATLLLLVRHRRATRRRSVRPSPQESGVA